MCRCRHKHRKPTCSLCRRVHDVPAQKQSDLRICRIFRSLQDEHERVPDAIGALASQAEQVGAVDRQRLLGHVGAQPYVGCRDLLAAQAENVHRDVVRRVQQIVLEERTEKDDRRGPASCRSKCDVHLYSSHFLVEVGLTSGSAYWWCRRWHQHQPRHAHAVEMWRDGIPLLVIQRQLGHYADLGITSAYLRGIGNTEIIRAVHERPVPMIPAATRL